MPDSCLIEMSLPHESQRMFFPWFQQGVELEVDVGGSLKDLLVTQCGIDADYLAERITTLFLNSKAIDDAATPVVGDGDVVALSGAMPGLVGATMRRGGHLAAMRGAMTYAGGAFTDGAKPGRITLKLFNILLEELTPVFLLRGILVPRQRYQDLFGEQGDGFRPKNCRLDGQSVAAEGLFAAVENAP